jgi:hypothetical protein
MGVVKWMGSGYWAGGRGGEFCGNWALGFIKSHIFGQIDRIC